MSLSDKEPQLKYYPDPSLRVEAKELTPEEIEELTRGDIPDKMLKIMKLYDGVGLAATQVGFDKRMFVMTIDNEDYIIANPIVIHEGVETESAEEGCLSFPGAKALINRVTEIELNYTLIKAFAESKTTIFNGLAARCIQHEIDHLNGVMFFDRLSSLNKSMFLEKQRKIAKIRARRG